MKSKLFLMMFVSALCLGFASCSDDDDDEVVDYAKEIAGTYVGKVAVNGTELPDEAKIEFVYNSKDNVTMKMVQNIAGQNIEIECKSPVTLKDNKYNVDGQSTVDLGYEQPIPVKVNGDVDKNKKAVINIVVGTEGMPGFPMNVVYTGTRK